MRPTCCSVWWDSLDSPRTAMAEATAQLHSFQVSHSSLAAIKIRKDPSILHLLLQLCSTVLWTSPAQLMIVFLYGSSNPVIFEVSFCHVMVLLKMVSLDGQHTHCQLHQLSQFDHPEHNSQASCQDPNHESDHSELDAIHNSRQREKKTGAMPSTHPVQGGPLLSSEQFILGRLLYILLCTFVILLRIVIRWWISVDKSGSRAGCVISKPSETIISRYLLGLKFSTPRSSSHKKMKSYIAMTSGCRKRLANHHFVWLCARMCMALSLHSRWRHQSTFPS